ncbi:MAG: hypothetical protein AAFW89_10230 [Bacteroidota bacterium]
MKLVIIILITLFPFYPNTNTDTALPVSQETEALESQESMYSAFPVYTGPTTVDFGFFVNFTVTPSSGCTNCTYYWRMRSVSDGLPITASDQVDETSSTGLPWIIGLTPTENDFYIQVEEYNRSTRVSKLTNAYYVTVNP